MLPVEPRVRQRCGGNRVVTNLKNHHHQLAGGQLVRQRHDLFAALHVQVVGDRQEIAVLAQALAHAV